MPWWISAAQSWEVQSLFPDNFIESAPAEESGPEQVNDIVDDVLDQEPHSLFPVVDDEQEQDIIHEAAQDLLDEPLPTPIQDTQESQPLIQHEMIPLVLEEAPVEIELCEDGEEKQEPGTECDDNNTYTQEDVIADDGCSCEGEVAPLDIIWSQSKITYDDTWFPVLWSVMSIDVEWGWAPFCSMIARLNLKQFYPEMNYVTGIQWPDTIAIWDAVTLIQDGHAQGLLTPVATRDIESLLDATDSVAHDLFIYTSRWFDASDPKRYLQGHRAVAFIADDEQRYVLDPLRGTATQSPQPLREYVYHYSNKNGQFYLYSQTLSPDLRYKIADTWVFVESACEIQVTSAPRIHYGWVTLSSAQACVDVIDLCR